VKNSLFNRFRSLMLPGLKRWILLILFGVLFVVFGVLELLNVHPVFLVIDLISDFTHDTAKFLGHHHSGIIAITAGGLFLCFAVAKIALSVLGAYVPEGRDAIPDVLFRRHQLGRGPKIVVIGGGTGLSNLLRGLKAYTNNLTAIVTVGDDGGSSGRLREELGVLPPGDIRNCITALADEDEIVTELFRYRFKNGQGLEGHSFGNLFLTAIYAITGGDMLEAVRVASRVLNSCGQVIPSTLTPLTLIAEMSDGTIIRGESNIGKSVGKSVGQIKRLTAEPIARATPAATEKILNADMIILGPGSLYTSIIPNLLISGIADAVQKSNARKLYVCNVMTQPGETNGYTVGDHIQAILDHTGAKPDFATKLVQAILVNDSVVKPPAPNYEPVEFDADRVRQFGVVTIRKPIVSEQLASHHDSQRLAEVVMAWYANKVTDDNKTGGGNGTANPNLLQRVASLFVF
jgi:uncharacterized cofD-like protein